MNRPITRRPVALGLGLAPLVSALPTGIARAANTPLKLGVGLFQPDRERNDATYRPLAGARGPAPPHRGEQRRGRHAQLRGVAAGLLTRIALRPFDGPERRHGRVRDGVHLDAIAVDHDVPRWRAQFLAMWPPGSDAHASYWDRIAAGPDNAASDALLHTED